MNTNALINYDTACRALAMAAKVDEVLNIRDRAKIMEAYGRQAKNRDLEVQACEIRLRAERKLGEMILQQKETVGLNAGGRPAQKTPSIAEGVFDVQIQEQETPSGAEGVYPTLAEMGIDYKLSSRAQKLAAVPEQEFEEHIEEHRQNIKAEQARVINKLERTGEAAQKKREKLSSDNSFALTSEDADRLKAENETLREKLTEVSRLLEETQAENDSLVRMFEADDKVMAALAEARRYREQNRILEERVRGLMNEKGEAIRAAKSWKRKAEQGGRDAA
jgi:hypothetical protein